MRKLANGYVSGAESAVRDVYVKIALNDEKNTVFEADEIVDLSISRSITDGSFGIGFTPSDRLSCTIISAEKVKKKTRMKSLAILQMRFYSRNGATENIVVRQSHLTLTRA